MHSEENGVLLYLYKVVEGVSNSFAFNIAAQVGLDDGIIKRAKELFESNKTVNAAVLHKNFSGNALINFLKDIDIPEPDVQN